MDESEVHQYRNDRARIGTEYCLFFPLQLAASSGTRRFTPLIVPKY